MHSRRRLFCIACMCGVHPTPLPLGPRFPIVVHCGPTMSETQSRPGPAGISFFHRHEKKSYVCSLESLIGSDDLATPTGRSRLAVVDPGR